MKADTLPIHINNKLLLRFATSQDADALGRFNQRIHEGSNPDDNRLAAWTIDLLTGKYPGLDTSDCTVVEDLESGKIVSSMVLLPQTWT